MNRASEDIHKKTSIKCKCVAKDCNGELNEYDNHC